MALDIGRAVSDGFRRTFERNGVMLAVAFFLLNLIAAFTGVRGSTEAALGGGNTLLMGAVGVVVSVLSLVVSIAGLRLFVTDETEVVPDAVWKRNMGPALLHTIVGSILFAVAVAIGFILLIIPGVYLLLALFFWAIYVAVEDQGFYEAMQSSWQLTKSHKWQLLGVIVVIFLVNAGLGLIGGIASAAGGVIGLLVLEALSAIGGVFALAVQARAYMQLTR